MLAASESKRTSLKNNTGCDKMRNFMVLLDRDDTVIEDKGYTHDPEHLKFKPGAIEGLQLLRDAGAQFVIITNQSGIARKIFTEKQMHNFHIIMLHRLAQEGIEILDIYHCPHCDADKCFCRKPKPGMINQALSDHGIRDTRLVWMIGDKDSDILAARNAHIKAIKLVDSVEKPLQEATTLHDAAQRIVEWIDSHD